MNVQKVAMENPQCLLLVLMIMVQKDVGKQVARVTVKQLHLKKAHVVKIVITAIDSINTKLLVIVTLRFLNRYSRTTSNFVH